MQFGKWKQKASRMTDEAREQFEKWACTHAMQLKREPAAPKIYWNPFTQVAWEGFEAGRLQGLEEAAKIADRNSYDSNDGWPIPRIIAVAAAIREKTK